MHTLFYFILAIGILVSFHEFGHFWVARKAGVKVLRFSVGFGKVLWSYKQTPDSTEYVISAIPLGGYVKMVDEREGEVASADLPFAFNRQSILARSAIVAAGPVFNFILAIALFWFVLMMGETGLRPVVGQIMPETLAAQAGFVEEDEIVAVNGETVKTWSEVMEMIFSSAAQPATDGLSIEVKSTEDERQTKVLQIPEELQKNPEQLYKKLGLVPWMPPIKAVFGKVLEGKPAEKAGLKSGDVLLKADEVSIENWMQWVDYVKERPDTPIEMTLEREGVELKLSITPEKVEENGAAVGKIGAAALIPEDLIASLQVTHSLSPWPAMQTAVSRTVFFSKVTLKMMGHMLIGNASVKNLSGPISIAQFAGISAERGLVEFLSFLAKISISLAVLNLLPIPVLDGGHLLFFAIEAVKGSPVSEKVQLVFQQAGILLLLSLMALAMFLDLERLFQ
ncbi:RIP metalloprotease RseP [Methylicorpusculum sp.]|uniref:RIP metalloprotease RseP n=1 Tax=Methylicorpusculum sp. TaxID=2713644 RepID=UPI00272F9321|nr:RIP metalloprotease RseP [Methylicorpusculum sp.]MDP2178576.1 RIP metalloprotease RseP [Methylicorpusculum sp.]MDP3530601.1 RIP metalloprotease RseP [Methylicorpusculum sp.]MDZ4154662.1 RIP metalloprotease RseP [Methylicorpusculum sp.]